MEQQSTESPIFLSNSDFWISEIRGNIARLNDASSVVETDIVLPMPTDNRLDRNAKIQKIRAFQLEFRRLYKNANQVLPYDIKKKIKFWLDESQKDITNVKMLAMGIELADSVQDVLYDSGIKDIDISGPVLFPFDYYMNILLGDVVDK